MTREDHFVCAALTGILGGTAFAGILEEAVRRQTPQPVMASLALSVRYAVDTGLAAAKEAEAPHVARVNGPAAGLKIQQAPHD